MGRAVANVLGDLRAEADQAMLNVAFLETADYKTLIETTDRPIVVGRRGTGKSALATRLQQHWHEASHTDVILLTPSEEQFIGLRALMPSYFSDEYRLIRAGARVAWRYALLAEIAHALSRHYKFHRSEHSSTLTRHAQAWTKPGGDVSTRLRQKLLGIATQASAPDRIAGLAQSLAIDDLQTAVEATLSQLKHLVIVLVDRVDEGYEPDKTGVAIVDALVLAAIDVNTRLDAARVTLFLRDNMARAVEQLDHDYSRDIEGQVLRLHWEENQLFSLVCNRLRVAFSLGFESDLKIWNRCTARALEGRDGFRRCLRLTLYRPRDILALLNDAYLVAARDGRQQIIETDVERTAHEISRHRLEDLHKEYSAILPGLQRHTSRFSDGPPEMTLGQAYALVDRDLELLQDDEAAAQTFALLNSPSDIGAALYSVGFLGVKDAAAGAVAFCHDGRLLDRPLQETDRVMIHPCYWMALSIKQTEVEETTAQEIFDDYDIRVVSQTPGVRKAKLSKMIGVLARIQQGKEGASEFEDWCLGAVKVIFAAQLTNIALHPNASAIQRRDIVATNHSRGDVWKRIQEDYQTRQVIFEVKNYGDLGPEEYRQMGAYLSGEYGRLGFIVTRDDSEDLLGERDLPWMKEMYSRHQQLIVKLTGNFLTRILSKMRSPQRHDEADLQLNKLLDTYTRNYLGEQVQRRGRKRHRSIASTNY